MSRRPNPRPAHEVRLEALLAYAGPVADHGTAERLRGATSQRTAPPIACANCDKQEKIPEDTTDETVDSSKEQKRGG